MALTEERNCSNCNDEDTDMDKYPCNRCGPYHYKEWSPKQEEGVDLYDM